MGEIPALKEPEVLFVFLFAKVAIFVEIRHELSLFFCFQKGFHLLQGPITDAKLDDMFEIQWLAVMPISKSR